MEYTQLIDSGLIYASPDPHEAIVFATPFIAGEQIYPHSTFITNFTSKRTHSSWLEWETRSSSLLLRVRWGSEARWRRGRGVEWEVIGRSFRRSDGELAHAHSQSASHITNEHKLPYPSPCLFLLVSITINGKLNGGMRARIDLLRGGMKESSSINPSAF